MVHEGQSRERRVIDTFVGLADTLANDYEISELLDFLVERCGDVLDADTAGVLVESPHGDLRLAAAMSEEMNAIEKAELSTGEGPCVESYRTREPVIVEDLAACEERWPKVTPQLLELGMRAGHAFPLRLRDDCLGALNLYRRETGGFTEEDIRLAQAFADVAAIGIIQARTIAEGEERSEQLQYALESRILIEQAKGILVERFGVDLPRAFEMIRTHARNHNRRLRAVCTDIVDGANIITPDER